MVRGATRSLWQTHARHAQTQLPACTTSPPQILRSALTDRGALAIFISAGACAAPTSPSSTAPYPASIHHRPPSRVPAWRLASEPYACARVRGAHVSPSVDQCNSRVCPAICLARNFLETDWEAISSANSVPGTCAMRSSPSTQSAIQIVIQLHPVTTCLPSAVVSPSPTHRLHSSAESKQR